MFLLYLDSSGTPLQKDVNSLNYVWIGLCMHEASWFKLDKGLNYLKKKYGYPDLPFELHVKQFAISIHEQDRISGFDAMSPEARRDAVLKLRHEKVNSETSSNARKSRIAKYRESDPFIHLNRRQRSDLLEEAVDIIASNNKVRLFGEAIDKSHPALVSNNIDPVYQAFTQVVSRFDKYLQKKAIVRDFQEGAPNVVTRYRPDMNGLLILDHDESTEQSLHETFARFRKDGHQFGNILRVIDVPFFASSERVGGLQFADVCAYVVRRYLDKGATPNSHEERLFLKLYQRFDRDNFGVLHGLRHFTSYQSCKCQICKDRKHS